MSHQLTFADSEFSTKRRQTRKEIFLSRMEQILPWQNMVEVIEPFYPKAGNGRRPYPLETMLRIHCMQHWYNLSDGAMEDALYEIASMRLFARLSLDSALPDRTTIMNFRHLLEQHQLARQLFKTINRWLAEAGVMMTQGTLVDATIIEAPSSTKNKEQQRDPEMHQTKKGNQWHFGMKAHIGVDAKSGLTHSLVTTAANEHDLNQLGNLLHGEEQFVSADAGYQERTARGAGRGGCGLADRRASRQGKNLEAASAQEQNGHQHRIHESQHPCQGGAPVSHHQAAVRLRESQIQRAAEKR
ncbi:Transposase [Klebsiella pneumoniae 30660/NJST258_1]|nr:Transposase [Klebsiella pneumoniae 30660/NJST258_1]